MPRPGPGPAASTQGAVASALGARCWAPVDRLPSGPLCPSPPEVCSRNAGPHLAPGTTLPCKHGHHRPLLPSLGARVCVGTAATEHSLPGGPPTITRCRQGCPGPLSAHRSTRKGGFRGPTATSSPQGNFAGLDCAEGQCAPTGAQLTSSILIMALHTRPTSDTLGSPGVTPASSPGGQ